MPDITMANDSASRDLVTRVEKTRVVVWGSSGHARVVTEILQLSGLYDLVGYIDDRWRPDLVCDPFLKWPVLGTRDCLDRLLTAHIDSVALGFGNCRARYEAARLVLAKGLGLVTAIHPHAIVSSEATIGAGTVIAAGAIINPGARIGECAIINTASSIDHDCVIGDGVHVAPGVHLAGHVKIGICTWVGLGALIKENIRIGADCLIGAGALVLDDIPDAAVAYGAPARIVRFIGDEDCRPEKLRGV